MEHKLADYCGTKSGGGWKFLRWFGAYIILVGSKFVMMGVVDLIFGDKVEFTGPLKGVVAFFGTIFAIVIAEGIFSKIYWSLADKKPDAGESIEAKLEGGTK